MIMSNKFQLVTEFTPKGDQPKAISQLIEGIKNSLPHQLLLGVTGSGKTFTIANVIAEMNMPTLVISHNKILAAQLYSEFYQLFPYNAVEYFVSYYDYYQPEAYIPQTDTYIQKDASINDELDRLRLAATCALLTRNDVIIVASVSCIYNIGSPEEYASALFTLECNKCYNRNEILSNLIQRQYIRNDLELLRSTFRVRGDTIEILPAYAREALRIEFFGDQIERISYINPITGERIMDINFISIYPAKYFIATKSGIEHAIASIEKELDSQLSELKNRGKFIEANRLNIRTHYDMELLRETGYCPGIENYSRHFSHRMAGQRPMTLIDYFPKDRFLMVIDESHVTIPQFTGMYRGDHSRKESLIEYGFRLPSAYDNRPLKFDEFEKLMPMTIYVSATPGPYELKVSTSVIEQIVRPTGLIDPMVSVRPTKGQIDSLIIEINNRVKRHERVLVTTLTKRMAEDLADYLSKEGIQVRYLHSEVVTLQRIEILRDLRLGKFDVLVGINLLREGLDLPEVSLVIILDADKEGFLRAESSLIQLFGRTARNLSGEVIMYADTITKSMQRAIDETNRRRNIQLEYNKEHWIIPQTIKKLTTYGLFTESLYKIKDQKIQYKIEGDMISAIENLELEMRKAADNLEYEHAAQIRDEWLSLKKMCKETKGRGVKVTV